MGDRHADREDEHAEPGRPRAEHRIRAREDLLGAARRPPRCRRRCRTRAGRAASRPRRAGSSPEIIWPSVSSRKAVVSATPGDEDDERRDDRPQARVGHVVLDRERRQRGDAKAARNGISTSTVRRPSPSRRSTPTTAPSSAAATTSRRGRMQDERDPDRRGSRTRGRSSPTRSGCPSAGSPPAARSRRPGRPRPRSACSASRWTAAIWSSRGVAESRRRRLDRRGPPAPEGQEERRREDAEAGVVQPVRAGDRGEAQLDRVDRLADRAQRRAEAGEEGQELVLGRLVRRRSLCSPRAHGLSLLLDVVQDGPDERRLLALRAA